MVNGLAYSGANFNLGFVSLNTFTYCEMFTDHDNQWFVFSNPYATWKVDVITQEVLDGFLLLDGLYYPPLFVAACKEKNLRVQFFSEQIQSLNPSKER